MRQFLSALLSNISAWRGEDYAYDCAAALLSIQSEFNESKLDFHENDEWARIELNGLTIWLCGTYENGLIPHTSGVIFEVDVNFYKTDDGNLVRLMFHDVHRAIEEIQELYANFYCSRNMPQPEPDRYQLTLPISN